MAAEAFAALNRILENRQRRESADRQYALALMQFDYQKKQADMVQVGKQLELLQGANAQMMNNVAQNFMSESGLDMIYNAEDMTLGNNVCLYRKRKRLISRFTITQNPRLNIQKIILSCRDL